MSRPTEPPTDPGSLHARARDELAALSFGEPVDPAVADHVRGCPQCREELSRYRDVVRLFRDGQPGEDTAARRAAKDAAPRPPERVWDGVLAALGADAPASAAPAPAAPAPAQAPAAVLQLEPRRPRLSRALLAAAAVVVLAGAGAAGWAIGHSSSPPQPNRSSEAVLAAQPGTPSRVHGTAVVHTSRYGYTLRVDSKGLPAPVGYYEVWLFDPSINQMVAVGTLGTGGRGDFTVPAGIDLRAYHVVDVSAQKYDGNNRHERSVLRGPLTF